MAEGRWADTRAGGSPHWGAARRRRGVCPMCPRVPRATRRHRASDRSSGRGRIGWRPRTRQPADVVGEPRTATPARCMSGVRHPGLGGRSRGLLLGGLRLRWRTWRRAYEFDRRLAQGADPIDSDDWSLRVGQLGSAESRRRLACALRGAVSLADRQPDPLRMPPLRRAEIQSNRELLLELAEVLGDRRPLGVEGLAMASLLITDGPSPLYHSDAPRSLACTVR